MLDDNDHRSIGQRQGLFHFQEEAPGMVFWHPSGLSLYRALESAVRRQLERDGYHEVRTPQVMRRAIWEASGHWQSFSAGMFRLAGDDVPAALKPVSCPGHLELVRRMAPSYRDLPLRIAEFGLVHRDEPGGVLHGLFRLRQFTQDDGHVFCEERHVVDEVARFSTSLGQFYSALGFEQIRVGFSTRPAERAGDDALWDRAESLLARAAEAAGLSPALQPGEGAFYGPKLEWSVGDRNGRSWQCGTIQLDLVLPGRFDAAYVDANGERRRPVMLHRAMLGSLERFIGVLLEQHRGQLPPWLAPEQVVVAPVAAPQRAFAGDVAARLRAAGVRARLDDADATLSRRVRVAHALGVPFFVVVGAREVESNSVAVRARAAAPWSAPRDAAIGEIVAGVTPAL